MIFQRRNAQNGVGEQSHDAGEDVEQRHLHKTGNGNEVGSGNGGGNRRFLHFQVRAGDQIGGKAEPC